MMHRLRQLAVDKVRRPVELWATFAGIVGCLLALKLALHPSPFGSAGQGLVGSLLMASAGLVALGGLSTGLGHLLPRARAVRRRRLEEDVTASAADVAKEAPLAQWRAVAGAPEEEITEQERRADAADSKNGQRLARLAGHRRRGRSERVHRNWAIAIGALAAGVLAHPWITWSPGKPSIAVATAASAEAASALLMLWGLRDLLQDRGRWPAEPEPPANARSLSPAYLAFTLPPVVAYFWHGIPGDEAARWLPAAAAAYLIVPTLIGLHYLFRSTAVARLDAFWRRAAIPYQRRVESAVVWSARGLGVVLVVCAAAFLALGVAIASSAGDTAAASMTIAGMLAFLAYPLMLLGDLRVDSDGEMIPAIRISETIEAHPLGASGLAAAFVLTSGLFALLSHVV